MEPACLILVLHPDDLRGDAAQRITWLLEHEVGVSYVYVSTQTEMAYVRYDLALIDGHRLIVRLHRDGIRAAIHALRERQRI